MIKCKTKNGCTRIKMKGAIEDIGADAFFILQTIRSSINKKCDGDGDSFLYTLTAMLIDPNGPVKSSEGFPTMADMLEKFKQERDSMAAYLKKAGGCNNCKHYHCDVDADPCESCMNGEDFPAWEWKGD